MKNKKNMEINRKKYEIKIMLQWVIYQFIFHICFSIDSMEGLSVLGFLSLQYSCSDSKTALGHFSPG